MPPHSRSVTWHSQFRWWICCITELRSTGSGKLCACWHCWLYVIDLTVKHRRFKCTSSPLCPAIFHQFHSFPIQLPASLWRTWTRNLSRTFRILSQKLLSIPHSPVLRDPACMSALRLRLSCLVSCTIRTLQTASPPGPSTRTTSHAIHNSDYSSQTEYDSPTVYEHWCKNFRKLGWPYPEKPDPSLSESPTQARATLPPSPSPSQDDYLAMPVCAFLEMPSQPMHSQMYGGFRHGNSNSMTKT